MCGRGQDVEVREGAGTGASPAAGTARVQVLWRTGRAQGEQGPATPEWLSLECGGGLLCATGGLRWQEGLAGAIALQRPSALQVLSLGLGLAPARATLMMAWAMACASAWP